MTEAEREERVAELVELYLDSLRQGKGQDATSFADAYPDFRDELMELLPALEEVESLSRPPTVTPVVEAHYPDSLGGFRLLEKIGSGGMGTVFRALQESLHREVAVKILAPSWSADVRHLEAFENESKLIAGLRHTNIVEVFGAGQEEGYRYYVMSLVKGQGLTAPRLVQAFPNISYAEAVARVGLQAAHALEFAHAHGVLHRDIKPGNLLLDESGVLHVSDFGLATVLNSGEEAPLVTQSHDGTLRYMAPERLTRGANSFACDQYSLGLTLYELISKRPAFRETEPGSLIHRICSAPLPPLRTEGELGAIINKAISFAPEDRYDSMSQLAADLQRFLNGEPVTARPAPWLRRYAMWCRRRPAVALWSHAAALLVVLLLASVSIGYMRVSQALRSENEQRLLVENQRQLAEKNAQIADAAMQRIFASMIGSSEGDGEFLPPTKADARLIQDLMPYYEEIAAQADGAGDKVAGACHVLATIALQTGDHATAERYFARACEESAPQSLLHAQACNGLASALFMQAKPEKAKQARENLLALVEKLKGNADNALRLELVRSLQLAARFMPWHGNRPGRGRPTKPAFPATPGRQQLLPQAAELLAPVLAAQPRNAQARLRQVELLSESRHPALRKLLAPQGETALSLLENLLTEQPDNEAYQRAYLRLAMRPPGSLHGRGSRGARRMRGGMNAPASANSTVPPAADMQRAADYARNLLAANPGDSELLLQFLLLRDRYSAQLSRAGKAEEAARENERTLGVLSFLSNRADFTPELRERLAMLVGMHPQGAADREQQEAELKLLLQNHDAERAKALRARLQQMRERRGRPPHWHGRARRPQPTP